MVYSWLRKSFFRTTLGPLAGVVFLTISYDVSAANGEIRYSKPPTYTVVSQGGRPHVRSTLTSAGYMRIYIQHQGSIYVMRKLRGVDPQMQRLDAASAAAVRREYGDRILRVNSLDTPITITHPQAGTYTYERQGGGWKRIGWKKPGSGTSSGGRPDEGGQDTTPVSSSGGHNGSVPVCQLTGTCGSSSGGGSGSSGGSSSGGFGSSSSSGGGSSGSSSGGFTGGEVKLCYASTGRTVNVGPSQLQSALNSASPGDQIVLSGGNYGGSYTYNKNASANAPIVIKGNGSAVFTGVFNMDGSYGVLAGVKFQGGRATMNGHHNRITRSLFANPATPAVEMKSGNHAYNRIDHNEFRTVRGYAVEIGAQRDASKHQGHRIDHNYVYDHWVAGSEEVMRMLTDAYRDSYITYEYNLFDKVLQGERHQAELISLKTAKSIVRGNTIINSPNTAITFRETNRTLAEGNYLIDGASIRVMGDDHVIRNNFVGSGGSIELRAGDGTMDTPTNVAGCPKAGLVPILMPGCKGAHAAARRALVENNTAAIKLGINYTGDNIPAANNVLRNNTGSISNAGPHTGTVNHGGSANTTARKLTMADVGINAPDPTCNGGGGSSSTSSSSSGGGSTSSSTSSSSSSSSGSGSSSSSGASSSSTSSSSGSSSGVTSGAFSFTPNYTQNWVMHKAPSMGASITQNSDGLTLTSAPYVYSGGYEPFHSSSVAIWSKTKLSGNFKVAFDYTRLDNVTRTTAGGQATVFYFGVKGTGDAAHPESIAQWGNTVPNEDNYLNDAKGLRLTFNNFNTETPDISNRMRFRWFDHDKSLPNMIGGPSPQDFPFTPNVKYHVEMQRTGNTFTVRVTDTRSNTTKTMSWTDAKVSQFNDGYFGIRQMPGRIARYQNFQISQ